MFLYDSKYNIWFNKNTCFNNGYWTKHTHIHTHSLSLSLSLSLFFSLFYAYTLFFSPSLDCSLTFFISSLLFLFILYFSCPFFLPTLRLYSCSFLFFFVLFCFVFFSSLFIEPFPFTIFFIFYILFNLLPSPPIQLFLCKHHLFYMYIETTLPSVKQLVLISYQAHFSNYYKLVFRFSYARLQKTKKWFLFVCFSCFKHACVKEKNQQRLSC